MKWLKKKAEFQDVYQHGNKLVGTYFIVLYICNPAGLQVGIVVSKKVGKAVIRNKMKRRLRAYLREKTANVACKMIIIARRNSADITWNQLNMDLDSLFHQLTLYENRQ